MDVKGMEGRWMEGVCLSSIATAIAWQQMPRCLRGSFSSTATHTFPIFLLPFPSFSLGGIFQMF